VVLHPCAGAVRAGTCLAVMGPSGAGKTTLINALSRRGPLTEGEVTYDGARWDASMRRRVAVVEQEDVVNASLTVRETLTFASLLRLPVRNQDERAAAMKRVEDLISLLRLDGCADTRVGDATASETRGISGGERKRLCIAEQLLPRPALLFCDEPTSGLDSSLALVVVRALADLASASGVTVIASIHQPSSQVFLTFNNLLLLHSGHAVYLGPTHEAAIHFAALGQPCPDGWSHADWLLEVLVGRKATTEELVAAHADALAGAEPDTPPPAAAWPDGTSNGIAHDASNSWGHEFGVLLQRSWRTLRPNLWSRETALMHGANGVIVGTCWFRLGYSQADLFPRIVRAP
jgi:ABC-type multidrug transport system ATPase subunit